MAARAATTMPTTRMEFAPASLSKSEAQPIGSYGLMGCFISAGGFAHPA